MSTIELYQKVQEFYASLQLADTNDKQKVWVYELSQFYNSLTLEDKELIIKEAEKHTHERSK